MKTRFRSQIAVAVIVITVAILSGCSGSGGDPSPEVVFFYMDDCDHCARMRDALVGLLDENPALMVEYYEMEANQSILWRLARRHNLGTSLDIPVIFVGDRVIIGEGKAQELALRRAVEACSTGDCPSPIR